MDEVPRGEIRVGDAERRVVDDHLQQAHGEGRLSLTEYEERSALVWAARTQADLDRLTVDLPAPVPAAVHTPVVRAGGGGSTVQRRAETWLKRAGNGVFVVAAVVALIWGGSQVRGADDGGAIFGEHTVRATADTERLQVGALFGHTEVIVPDDVRVTTTGGMIFGSTDCELACVSGPEREIVVDSRGAFGQVEIMTEREFLAGGIDDDADDRDDDDDDDD